MKLYDFVFSIYKDENINFDHLTEEEKKEFNNFMVTRVISIDHENLDLVNSEFNGKHLNIPDQNLYNILQKTFSDDSKQFDVSYKRQTVKEKPEIVEAIKNYFELTLKEARQYLLVLSTNQIEKILFELGWCEKKINKINEKS